MSDAATIFKLLKITPRKEDGVWLFDDPAVGLEREPFVSGADDIIEAMANLSAATVEQKAVGLDIYFSVKPFTINGVSATRMERIGFGSVSNAAEQGACGSEGAWYRVSIDGQ